jgi:hypothetical protein
MEPIGFRINDKIVATIAADRFLRNMVQCRVNDIYIGLEKNPYYEFEEIINSKEKQGFSVQLAEDCDESGISIFL